MRTSLLLRSIPCAAAVGAAFLVLRPFEAGAFSTLPHTLDLGQRDVRVLNNFQDPSANDNTAPHPNWPGYTGAPLAVWKAVSEWGSLLHGDGTGDPSQPGDLGSGGANFDVTWQGLAPDAGNLTGNVVSTAPLGGGVLADTSYGASGWRIRLNEDFVWDDGPGAPISGALDIQGVLAHEYGHALGLGHSSVSGATMFASASGSGVAARSIEADDKAGIQFLYGAIAPTKPRIDALAFAGSQLEITGANFAPSGNEVWFTMAGGNATGEPLRVTGLVSSNGGTRILVGPPAVSASGDVLVKVPGSGPAALSNAFPYDEGCSTPTTVYCTAKTNSLGCPPAIFVVGTPSASAGVGFSISAVHLLSHQPGILIYSTAGPAATPFQGGVLCLQAPVVRTPVQSSGGTLPPGSDCSGSFGLDFNAWIATGSDPSLVPGALVWAQYWSRDPGFPPPDNSSLTNAVAFAICD